MIRALEIALLLAPLAGFAAWRIWFPDAAATGPRIAAMAVLVAACVALLAGQALEQATLFGARYRAVVDNAVDGIITISDIGMTIFGSIWLISRAAACGESSPPTGTRAMSQPGSSPICSAVSPSA